MFSLYLLSIHSLSFCSAPINFPVTGGDGWLGDNKAYAGEDTSNLVTTIPVAPECDDSLGLLTAICLVHCIVK